MLGLTGTCGCTALISHTIVYPPEVTKVPHESPSHAGVNDPWMVTAPDASRENIRDHDALFM